MRILFNNNERQLNNAFYKDISLQPDMYKVACCVRAYCTQEDMCVEDFISINIDELYTFTDELNEWCTENLDIGDVKYSCVYVRGFQNYVRKKSTNDVIDKAVMDSALVDHAVKKLLKIIDSDGFDTENLSEYAESEGETVNSKRRKKWDKLKAIDILLKYATVSQVNERKSAPSTALQNLMSSLLGGSDDD